MSATRTRLVRPQFVERMEVELVANSDKGDWREWVPTREYAMEELGHHVEKLRHVLRLQADNPDQFQKKVGEFCADVASMAMKIDEIYGQGTRLRHPRQRFYVPLVDEAWEPGFNCDPANPPCPFIKAT